MTLEPGCGGRDFSLGVRKKNLLMFLLRNLHFTFQGLVMRGESAKF